ncbi:MAG: HAD family hydrolase [Terriglobia bacterium]
MSQARHVAFYDFDGTLVSSNIVTRYAFLLRRLPSRARAAWRFTRIFASVPAYLVLDRYSRRLFNETFFREYRGMSRAWLEAQAETLFRDAIQPSIYPGAKELVDSGREQGYYQVLLTGELDFVLGPVVRYFGFDRLVSNALEFEGGVATGNTAKPLVAEDEKVKMMARVCEELGTNLRRARAYSDSFSDLPMLESAGEPVAVNPDARLKKVAAARRWPVLDLRAGSQ